MTLKQKYSNSIFWSLNIVIWDLPFDLAQGGELVEPFVICLPAVVLAGCLVFEISIVGAYVRVVKKNAKK